MNSPVAGKAYHFSAVTEPRVHVEPGQVKVIETISIGRHKAFHVYSDFDDPAEESWIADNGQVLKAAAPIRGVTSTLVGSADEAIGELDFNRSSLVKLYGEIPTGNRNIVAQEKPSEIKNLAGWTGKTYSQDPGALVLKLPRTASK